MPRKTITAKFETIDMAELAAHGLANSFRHISNIRIRYKNVPQEIREEHDRTPGRPAGEAFAGVLPGGALAPGAFSLFFAGLDRREATPVPEIEQTTESRMIVEAGEKEARQIAGKLRCLGGYEIQIR